MKIRNYHLSKLSSLVKNNVVKKTECNELVKKFNNISSTDTSNLVLKTDYNPKNTDIENEIITDHE